ncbi:hypothetical protein PMAG_a1150 [Pseudoalteromonas mariniglutinosa NCIMB 1770]|nr:hypothetical protein [Pseudoalteromonas mariniglutinosa NCIMB 1770]
MCFACLSLSLCFVIKIDNSLLGNNQAWVFKSVYEKIS